jgi:hypothetical protein
VAPVSSTRPDEDHEHAGSGHDVPALDQPGDDHGAVDHQQAVRPATGGEPGPATLMRVTPAGAIEAMPQDGSISTWPPARSPSGRPGSWQAVSNLSRRG